MSDNCPEGCFKQVLLSKLEADAHPERIIEDVMPGWKVSSWHGVSRVDVTDPESYKVARVTLVDLHAGEDIAFYNLSEHDKDGYVADPKAHEAAQKRYAHLKRINERIVRLVGPVLELNGLVESCPGMVDVTTDQGERVRVCGAEIVKQSTDNDPI